MTCVLVKNLLNVLWLYYFFRCIFVLCYIITVLCIILIIEINDSAVNQNLSLAYGLPTNQRFSLNDFTYNNDALQQIIFRHLNRTKFGGITVRWVATSSHLCVICCVIFVWLFFVLICCFISLFSTWMQGNVQFSDQGIREVTRLFIFQFRSEFLISYFQYTHHGYVCMYHTLLYTLYICICLRIPSCAHPRIYTQSKVMGWSTGWR